MRILLSSLLLVSIHTACLGQSFRLTPNGIVDSKYHSKNFIVVHIDSVSQKELFNAAHRHITSAYTYPQKIMTTHDNDLIALDVVADVPFSDGMHLCTCRMRHRINIEFKDGRYRLEFIVLSLQMLYGGKLYDITYVKRPMRWGFFKKDGELTTGGKLAKLDIEAIPNDIILGISKQLSNSSSEDW